MAVNIKSNIDIKRLKEEFKISLDKELIDKEFSIEELKQSIIPKIIAEIFILKVLPIYENVNEFDVIPIKKDNLQLIKINNNQGEPLIEALVTTISNENKLKIKNVIASIKHI